MTLADKRRVIEVLLATADRLSPTMDEMIDDDFDCCNAWFGRDSIKAAQLESDRVLDELPFDPSGEAGLTTYDTCAITAAHPHDHWQAARACAVRASPRAARGDPTPARARSVPRGLRRGALRPARRRAAEHRACPAHHVDLLTSASPWPRVTERGDWAVELAWPARRMA